MIAIGHLLLKSPIARDKFNMLKSRLFWDDMEKQIGILVVDLSDEIISLLEQYIALSKKHNITICKEAYNHQKYITISEKIVEEEIFPVIYIGDIEAKNSIITIQKPININILFAVINKAINILDYIFSIKGISIDLNRKIFAKNGEVIELTDKEAAIIDYLLKHNHASKDEILLAIWGYDEKIDTRTLESHIYNLRQKFGEYNIITTISDGYIINL